MATNDGGPAYPSRGYATVFVPDKITASVKKIVEELNEDCGGMSLRDAFAIAALQGMLASGHQEAIETVWISSGKSAAGGLAMAAYGFADAMLAARSQPDA